ncbi:Short-chain dehydrogenase/reductase family 16C member-like protein [Hapsidospora chrysogenum ATCC 11550]|uniref:Short-chain dehydrogenase/reductase 3 n=1 Tax=Hapsidospora chrysogenum (strain ATCC 11550 / CBS 779.69 / DSM 880 / IAM 14645 / JCM 23072 / IMI 49137) TaxID=857340 RepID=A0A086T0X0_HAPC1|nr:Short-chain dehydrogenase/reductase family 16C member-like protein [Hapsidospora chrysogenum ATCC 11550]
MPMHSGLLPREGFCLDVILKLVRATALNPSLLLPLLLLARYTKQGQDLSILHPVAHRRLRNLFCVALVRSISGWFSDRVSNNWVNDRYDWSKEIVVVTGGAGGIGGAIVRTLEEKGITVVVLDVQPLSFKTSSKVHHFQCDLRSPQNVMAVADQVRAKVGHPTVIINNAGVARGKTILEADPSDIRFTFDVNTFALFWTTQAFLPHMVKTNHGMVVTVSSYASWLTISNMVDYGASKAAAMAFHEGLAAELKSKYNAPRVRTVVVHPGHTRTPLFKGYNQNTGFVMPEQFPESIAEAVVKQVLTGRSGRVIQPEAGGTLPGLRAMPDWYQVRLRAKALYMDNWQGRQVIQDVGAAYDGEDKGEASESTVLVSEE